MMSETPKFTPGPWVAGLERMGQPDKRKIWAISLQVASAQSIWIPQEVQEANARLIAAAPELYEALKACQLQLLQSNNRSEYAEEAIQMAQAALRKAGGPEAR